jgi:hypothetical protein
MAECATQRPKGLEEIQLMPDPDGLIQDPYLGRQSLYLFDTLIPPAMTLNKTVADWTHGRELTRLQQAACQIIPNGFSIALSIRELLRKGYLFSAEILLRPLLERLAVVSYLIDIGDTALDLWALGWPHRTRPSLTKMLDSIKEFSEFDQLGGQSILEYSKRTVSHFNSIIHADPAGLDTNIGLTVGGVFGYLSAANLNDPARCDIICHQVVIYISLLMKKAADVFPGVQNPPPPAPC